MGRIPAWLVGLLLPAVVLAQSEVRDARAAFRKAAEAAKTHRIEEAVRCYERAVSLDPKFADAWSALGRVHAEHGRYGEAQKCFKTAIAAAPDFIDSYLPLAMLQHGAREWEPLLETTGRLLKLEPLSQPLTWLLNAAANYNLRRFPEAEKSAREARRLDAAHKLPRAALLLGQILIARGDFGGASEQLREFLDMAPADADAAAVRTQLGQLEERLRKSPPAASAGATNATFRADTKLALVRFQVTPDRKGFLTDLRPDDIELREDGIAQPMAVFEGGRFYPQKLPLEITILFDASGSVQSAGILDPYAFHANLLQEHENASIAIYGFSADLFRFTGPTRDQRRLKQAMDGVLGIHAGNTPLFRHIAQAAREATAQPASAVRMLIVISDGFADLQDIGYAEEAARVAADAGIAICPVLLSAPTSLRMDAQDRFALIDLANQSVQLPATGMARAGYTHLFAQSAEKFTALAGATGGASFHEIATDDVLPRILRAIGNQIRYDYVAGYYPRDTGKPSRHNVEVVWRSTPRGQIIGGKRATVH